MLYVEGITDKSILALADRCPRLTEIELAACSEITSDAIKNISKKCKNLTKINLNGCEKIDSGATFALAEFSTKLTHINFYGCNKLTSNLEALTNLATNCKHLTHINLGYCTVIDDSYVKVLFEKCKKLVYINLEGCHKITTKFIGEMVQTYPYHNRKIKLNSVTNNVS